MAQQRGKGKEKKEKELRAKPSAFWLTWVVWSGVALSGLGVTLANLTSSELTKTIWLSWVVAFGLVVWLCVVVTRGVVGWRWHALDLAVLGWLVVNILAAWHSSLPRVSVWGFGDVYADGLVAVVSMVGVYVLLVNLPGRFSLRLWMWLGVGLAVAGSLAVLVTAISPFPVSLLSRLASQTGVCLAVALPLVLSLRLGAYTRTEKWLSLGSLAVLVSALVVLDQTVAWWMVLVACGIWILGQAWFTKISIWPRMALVTGFMVLAVVGLSVPFSTFQSDVFISNTQTWQIILQHLSPALGAGQNNFILLSAANNPKAYTFFTLASSSMLGWLITLGIGGVLSWLSIVGCAVYGVVRAWRKTLPTPEQWGTAATVLSLVVAAWFLPLGFVGVLLFWMLLAALHRSLRSPTQWVIKSYRIVTNLALLGIAVVSVILVLAVWVGGRELVAQFQYWKGQQLFAQGVEPAQVVSHLQAAQQLAPQQAEYNFALAELLIIQQQSTPQAQWDEIKSLIQTGVREAPYQTQWKLIYDQITQSRGE